MNLKTLKLEKFTKQKTNCKYCGGEMFIKKEVVKYRRCGKGACRSRKKTTPNPTN